MKHLGDITKINGAEVEPVEAIIGGSPCQDLSVAGKRAGLGGERSGLFMEQIRIIKEMRENDRANGRPNDAIRPRYMVWENVPGAFSSNKGEDFRIVLEETAKIADSKISIPRSPSGKWTNAGCIMGRGYSIAWRVLDAQYFGVPQRRRRIALVADFGGETAPEILFEPESLSRDIEQSGTERQGTAGETESGFDKAISFQERAGCAGGGKGILIQHDRTGAISTLNNQSVLYDAYQHHGYREGETCNTLTAGQNESIRGDTPLVYGISAYESNAMKSSNPHSGVYEADTSRTLDNNGGNPACNQGGMAVVYDARGNGSGDLAPTITGDHQDRVTDYTALCIGNGQMCNMSMKPIANSLDTMHDQQAVITAVDCRNGTENPNTNGTLQSKSSGGTSLNLQNVCRTGLHIRRLTPIECERLQGYPDGWTNIGEWTDSRGKKHKDADSPRYKALGNSIAVPCWRFILQRISEQVTEHTMASLFDGIGGFPLIWEQINGAKSCRWVSEIEEFPIAVTKRRFEQEE